MPNEQFLAIDNALKKLPRGHWTLVDQIHKPTGLRILGITYKDDNEDSDWVLVIEAGDSEHVQAICDVINGLNDIVTNGGSFIY